MVNLLSRHPTSHRSFRLRLVVSSLSWCLVVAGWTPSAGSAAAARDFDPDLLPAGVCAGLTRLTFANGAVMCTHGPDPAPEGVDPGIPWTPSAEARPQGFLLPDPPGGPQARQAADRGIACYGDGQSGNRVQAVYASAADRPDRYAQVVASIRQWAAETDAVFQQSAAKTGGTRRIRFVTDGACNLVVLRVRLTARGDDTFENTVAEFQAQGLNRHDRKYLVWMDATAMCGMGSYYVDDRPGRNANDGLAGIPGTVARIDSGCWGLGSRGQSIEAHELMHNLGTVQPTAPNASPAGHCRDDADRMCYEDGSVLSILVRCPASQEALFDCGNDDYFSAAAKPTGYLASHWNAAGSSFLSGAPPTPAVSISDASADEGDSGVRAMTFKVSLSSAAGQRVTVRYATADSSARAGSDYNAANGTIAFNPGETTKALEVAIRGDTAPEPNETLTVVLSSPLNAVLERARGTGTIIDDEPGRQGYWFVASDGGIFAYGGSRFHGSTGDLRLNQPVVGMARTPSGEGYWLVARDGGIFSFGDARFFGSTGDLQLNQPIVGMAATPTGGGYWFVAADGQVFAFGDARDFGSQGAVTGPVAGMAASRNANGYWLAGQDGAVYAFGEAGRFGSTGPLNRRVVGIAATPTGNGHWLVGEDGGIFTFGDATFLGSTGDIRLNRPIVGIAPAL